MTPYEITYLALVAIQTGFLIWYAMETFKLRRDAARQNDLMTKQIAASSKQNRLLEYQLASLARAQNFHEKTVDQAADATFVLTYGGNDDMPPDSYGIVVYNINENVVFTDYRCSEKLISVGPVHYEDNKHKFLFYIKDSPERTVYFGVEYKTKRNETKTQVFSIPTEGEITQSHTYDFNKLTSYIKG
jgi:hypothetical protein